MSFTEDFLQKYQGTYIRANDKWFVIAEAKALKSSAKHVKDLVVSGCFWNETPSELLGSAVTWDFSIPENRLINGDRNSYWFTRSPERQWHRGLCKNNSKFLQVGNNMLYYITRHLMSEEQIDIRVPDKEESFDELTKLLFDNKNYPSYSQAIKELLEGKKLTVAIDTKYSVGLDFPSANLALYRKTFKVGEISPERLGIIHCLVPALKQEVLDFTRKIPGVETY